MYYSVSRVKYMNNQTFAFTLAEVLITLGIIGIVAAMTMPVLVGKYKDKEYAAKTKKAYSVIQQAIKQYQADNETIGDVTGLFDTSKTSTEVMINFSKYFNTVKVCPSKNVCSDLFYDIRYAKPLYDNDDNATSTTFYHPKFVLADGTVIGVMQYSACSREETSTQYNDDGTVKKDSNGNIVTNTYIVNYCATVTFDINGSKNPNQYGRDLFSLRIKENGEFGPGWIFSGYESLKNILMNKDPIYTNYNIGDKF